MSLLLDVALIGITVVSIAILSSYLVVNIIKRRNIIQRMETQRRLEDRIIISKVDE